MPRSYTQVQFTKTCEWITRKIKEATELGEDRVEYTLTPSYTSLILALASHFSQDPSYRVKLVQDARKSTLVIQWETM